MRAKMTLDPTPDRILEINRQRTSSPNKRKRNYLVQEVNSEGDNSGLIGIVDEYLTRHIQIVNQSREKEMKELKRIKESLNEKMNVITLNIEDIDGRKRGREKGGEGKKGGGMNGGTMRRRYHGLKMDSLENNGTFESQVNQCDRLLYDLGVKCRQYASVSTNKNYTSHDTLRNEFKSTDFKKSRELPLLKFRRSQAQIISKKKPLTEQPQQQSSALTIHQNTKNYHPPTKSIQSRHKIPSEQSSQKQDTIDPLKQTIQSSQNFNRGRRVSRQYSKTIETSQQQQFSFNQPKNTQLSSILPPSSSQIKTIQQQILPINIKQPLPISQSPQRKLSQQLINNDSISLKNQRKISLNQTEIKQNNIKSQLSLVKMRGMKLYERIRDYKNKSLK